MKSIFKIIIIFFVIIFYVFIINIFASLISITYEQEKITTETIISGTSIKIGVSESVSIKVIRKKHFYGRFIINDGKEHLNFLHFIKLPWRVKNHNFWIFHLIFLISLTLFTILIFIKQKTYKE